MVEGEDLLVDSHLGRQVRVDEVAEDQTGQCHVAHLREVAHPFSTDIQESSHIFKIRKADKKN